MFREMRRFKQALSEERCIEILKNRTSGVLAVSGDDGYPYAVPLSFVYHEGTLYFHGAKTGHKIDAILRNSKVSFCVTDLDRIVPEKFTTYFRSVIVFGTIRILTDEAEKRNALTALAEKYSPAQSGEALEEELQKTLPRVCLLALTVDYMSGKEARELAETVRS